MIRGIASLLKLWITVALSAGALVATVEVDSTLSPFKVNSERHPAVPATFSHSYAGSAYYPSGLVRDQPIPNNDEVVYVDEGPSSKDEDAEQLKRSMGMLRLGRASSSLDKRARSMAGLRLGRSLPAAAASAAQSDDWRTASNSWKRTMGMLRLGRRSDAAEDDEVEQDEDEDTEEEKRSMGMLRLGRSSRQHQPEDSAAAAAGGDKRSMGMLRLGRSAMRRMLSR